MKKAMTWQLEDYSSNNLKLEEDSHVPLFWKKSHVVAVFVERFCNWTKIHDVRTLIEYFSKKKIHDVNYLIQFFSNEKQRFPRQFFH